MLKYTKNVRLKKAIPIKTYLFYISYFKYCFSTPEAK